MDPLFVSDFFKGLSTTCDYTLWRIRLSADSTIPAYDLLANLAIHRQDFEE